MTFPGRAMVQGTFTVPATLPARVNVNCGFIPSKIELINRSEIGDNSANENWERVCWNTDFGSANNYVEWHTASSTAMNVSNVTSNGISAFDGHNSIQLGSQITGTVITKATNAVVTATSHGLQQGDLILMTNNAVMTQLGGLIMQVRSVSDANTFTLYLNTNTANFTQETNFKFKRIIVGPLYYPNWLMISNISQANGVVISTLAQHNLTVGQQVRIRVPSVFGMVEINNLQGVITAVANANGSTTAPSITIGGIDSTNFTAWAWPATTKVPFTPAFVQPIGAGPTVQSGPPTVTYNVDPIDDATDSQAFQGFTVGTNLLQTATGSVIGVQASDVISWTAWRQDA